MSPTGNTQRPSGRQTLLRPVPTGDLAFTISNEETVIRWSLQQGQAAVASVHPLGRGPIADLAVGPEGQRIAVAFKTGPPQLYDLNLADGQQIKLTTNATVTRLAFSPCARMLALATSEKSVLLYELETGQCPVELEAGEKTLAIKYSPDGKWFCWAHSGNEGAAVAIARVESDDLKPARGLELASKETPREEFVDTVPAVAFSHDCKRLALFQTSMVYQERKPPGWRGDVVYTGLESRRIMGGLSLQPDWQLSVDARLTEDPKGDSGLELNVPAQLSFCAQDRFLALGLSDRLIILDPLSGEPVRQDRFPALSLAPSPDGVWIAGDGLRHLNL